MGNEKTDFGRTTAAIQWEEKSKKGEKIQQEGALNSMYKLSPISGWTMNYAFAGLTQNRRAKAKITEFWMLPSTGQSLWFESKLLAFKK